MRESEILSAIDESPNGELDEAVIFSGVVPGAGAVNVTNTLAKMRRSGAVKRVRKEDGTRVYTRATVEEIEVE